jgi:ribonuclease P protein component
LRPVARLKRRADFLRAGAGDRFHARAFSLQATALKQDLGAASLASARDVSSARFGITVTKKIGGAVERNRIRRRFKEALRLAHDLPVRAGRDYVIVAKAEALTTDFLGLQTELMTALRKIDRPTRQRPPKPKPLRR